MVMGVVVGGGVVEVVILMPCRCVVVVVSCAVVVVWVVSVRWVAGEYSGSGLGVRCWDRCVVRGMWGGSGSVCRGSEKDSGSGSGGGIGRSRWWVPE